MGLKPGGKWTVGVQIPVLSPTPPISGALLGKCGENGMKLAIKSISLKKGKASALQSNGGKECEN